MAGTYLRRPLSGSTDGRGVKVAATSTPGTTLHTAQASASLCDYPVLYAYNSDVVERTLTMEWGGTTAPDDNQTYPIPAGRTVPIVPDGIIRNSLVIKAFCDAANKVVVFGNAIVES